MLNTPAVRGGPVTVDGGETSTWISARIRKEASPTSNRAYCNASWRTSPYVQLRRKVSVDMVLRISLSNAAGS